MAMTTRRDQIEAAARALYEHWSAPDAPDWKEWDDDAADALNGGWAKTQTFRENAEAIIGLDPNRAGRELCWRGAPCAGIECPTAESCIGDEYYMDGARKALEAAAQDLRQGTPRERPAG